jgi:prepilin-type N-terminal cleavage/methylation domain-containing protein
MKSLNAKGFTIVELLIAISIFSSLLIIIVYAFLYGLNTFTKSQIVSNTQETARSIEQNLTQSLSLTASGGYTTITPTTTGDITTNGFCLGQYRYSYVPDKKLTNSNFYGLWQDTYYGCSPSTKALDLSANPKTKSYKNLKQLLGNNMRLSNFAITPVVTIGSGYQIQFEVDYGDQLQLNDSGAYKYHCPSGSISSSFCAVAKVDTIVFQRVQ